MKKIDILMQELGFNKNAPKSVKEAFVKHLIKASTGTNVMTPSEEKDVRSNSHVVVSLTVPEQLSFDFMDVSKDSSQKAVS